jgi:hypothetical protein
MSKADPRKKTPLAIHLVAGGMCALPAERGDIWI